MVLLYAAIVVIAMAGWLWFLGWVNWRLIAWVLGE